MSTTSILSKFILPHLWAHIFCFGKQKPPKFQIMNTFHRFELPYKPLNFSPSCLDNPWCTQECELVYISNLEKVQRRAARFSFRKYSCNSSVSYILKVLDWRLECQRLNFIYKSSHNLNGVDLSKYVTLSESQTRRSHDMVFNHLSPRTDVFKFSFFPRTIPVWNSLPQEVVYSPNLTAFSSRVNGWRSCSVTWPQLAFCSYSVV